MTANRSTPPDNHADRPQGTASSGAVPHKPLTPAAERALAEAAERRRQQDQALAEQDAKAKELGGRQGPDPARYGDWENGGIASDF